MDWAKLGQKMTVFLGNLSQERLLLLVVGFGAICIALVYLFDYNQAWVAAAAVGMLGAAVIVLALYNFILV